MDLVNLLEAINAAKLRYCTKILKWLRFSLKAVGVALIKTRSKLGGITV